MGPTPEQGDAFKQLVGDLNKIVNEKAIDWNKSSGIVLQLVSIIISGHTKPST